MALVEEAYPQANLGQRDMCLHKIPASALDPEPADVCPRATSDRAF